jgi:hypothetical protein
LFRIGHSASLAGIGRGPPSGPLSSSYPQRADAFHVKVLRCGHRLLNSGAACDKDRPVALPTAAERRIGNRSRIREGDRQQRAQHRKSDSENSMCSPCRGHRGCSGSSAPTLGSNIEIGCEAVHN